MRLIGPLLCYVAGFALFMPVAFTVVDEGLYVAQAVAFSQGARTIPRTDPLTGAVTAEPASAYPIGTSLLQTPFVRVGGWRAAAWASVVALIATVLLLAQWLRDTGANPLFALLFLLYAPALVLGRVAMSDVPSACIVTLALWLFWRSRAAGGGMQFLTGTVCALSAMFRETNVLIAAPFIVGAVVRRDRQWPALVAGVVTGAMIRLASFWWMYGDPFFLRDHGAGFAVSVAPSNAVLYVIALIVLLPGGLVGVYLYRGPHRAEIIMAVLLMFVLYLFYGYSGTQSSRLQQLVLGPRFFIPLVPLIVVACAHAVRHALAGASSRLAGSERLIGIVVPSAACVAAFLVHPVLARYTETQASIVRTIYDVTSDNSVIVGNLSGIQKFINPVHGVRAVAYREDYAPETVGQIVARNARTFLVFVDRNDSDFFRADAAANASYLVRLQERCRLVPLHDYWYGSANHLRVWRAESC